MQRTRTTWALVLVAVLAIVAAACSDDDTKTATSNSSPGTSSSSAAGASIDYSKLGGALNGSGASFPDAYYQKAMAEFAKEAAGVTLNYTKSGSSAGKTDLANQVVQFAGTDSTVKDADKATRRRLVPLRPDRGRADHRVVQPRGRRQAAAERRHARQDLPAAPSRPGTTRRSPPTTPASPCRPSRSPSCTARTARARRTTSPST